MKKLTYKEAFDKITEAYIKGEIRPFSPTFCFCGTLCNGDGWYRGVAFPAAAIQRSHSGYSGEELGLIEHALLKKVWHLYEWHNEWEDALFEGMCAALEVLKQIHKERGENVEDFEFVKRPIKGTKAK